MKNVFIAVILLSGALFGATEPQFAQKGDVNLGPVTDWMDVAPDCAGNFYSVNATFVTALPVGTYTATITNVLTLRKISHDGKTVWVKPVTNWTMVVAAQPDGGGFWLDTSPFYALKHKSVVKDNCIYAVGGMLGSPCAWMAKLDLAGNIQWLIQKPLGGGNTGENYCCITADSKNNVYFGGQATSNGTGYFAYICELDKDGNLVSEIRPGDYATDYTGINSCCLTNIAAGYEAGNDILYCVGNRIDGAYPYYTGYYEWLGKYKTNGDMVSRLIFGGTPNSGSACKGMYVLNNTDVYVLLSGGDSNLYVRKYDNNLSVKWEWNCNNLSVFSGPHTTYGWYEVSDSGRFTTDGVDTFYVYYPVSHKAAPNTQEPASVMHLLIIGADGTVKFDKDIWGECAKTLTISQMPAAGNSLRRIIAFQKYDRTENVNSEAKEYHLIEYDEFAIVLNGNFKVLCRDKGYANPNNGDTVTFYYKATDPGTVTFKILNMRGELLNTFSTISSGISSETYGFFPANSKGENLPSGIYLAKIEGPGLNVVKKFAVMR